MERHRRSLRSTPTRATLRIIHIPSNTDCSGRTPAHYQSLPVYGVAPKTIKGILPVPGTCVARIRWSPSLSCRGWSKAAMIPTAISASESKISVRQTRPENRSPESSIRSRTSPPGYGNCRPRANGDLSREIPVRSEPATPGIFFRIVRASRNGPGVGDTTSTRTASAAGHNSSMNAHRVWPLSGIPFSSDGGSTTMRH